MRIISSTGLALFVLVCASGAQTEQITLMDEIERSIAMPIGARPLAEYARFYARARDGKIVGAYILPTTGVPFSLKAGERRWSDEEHVPVRLDGGCSYVRFEYDPRTRSFLGPDCNGDA